MKEVEVLSHSVSTCHVCESCNTVLSVNLCQVVLEELLNTFIQARLVKSNVIVIIRWEHDGRGSVVSKLGVFPNTILSPCIFAKIENLLRSTSTFDWELGTGKDGITALESVSHHGCLISSF